MGGSPVPACMFAPEPGSPGGGPRVAAAACPLRTAFDAEDGEALNGEPEIDLTSKVGPAGGRAAASAIGPPGPALPSPRRPPRPWGARLTPAAAPRPGRSGAGRPGSRRQPLSSPLPSPREGEGPRWGPACLHRGGGVTLGLLCRLELGPGVFPPRPSITRPGAEGRAAEPAVPWGGGREKRRKVELRGAERELCPGRERRVLAGLSALLLPLLGSPGERLQPVWHPLGQRRV